MQDLTDRLGTLLVTLGGDALVVAIVIVAAWLAYRVFARVVRTFIARAAAAPLPGELELGAEQQATRRAERRRRLDTVATFGLRLVSWFAVAVIVIVVISVFLPSVWAAIGGLGVGFGVAIGGAIGFGAQQLVRDYLNGILILGENPYSVGDIVAIAGVRGSVEEIGLRRTVIRDNDGTVHSVPNGEIQVASNFTRRFARVDERFMVAYGTDIARATAVINAVGEALAGDQAWAPRLFETPDRAARRSRRRSGHPDPGLVHRPARRAMGGRGRVPAPRPRSVGPRGRPVGDLPAPPGGRSPPDTQR